MPRRYLNFKSVLTYITGWMTTLFTPDYANGVGLLGALDTDAGCLKASFIMKKSSAIVSQNDKLEQKNWLSTIWFTEQYF